MPQYMPHSEFPYMQYTQPLYMQATNEVQEMQPVQSMHTMHRIPEGAKRSDRGRGKRNDNYNRGMNHCNDVPMGYIETNNYPPMQNFQPVFFNQQQGTTIYYAAPYSHPSQMHQTNPTMQYTRFPSINNNTSNNNKYPRQPQTNGEAVMPHGNTAFQKDRVDKHRNANPRAPKQQWKQTTTEDENKLSQTNIHTTVTVKTSNEENSTSPTNKKVPSNVEKAPVTKVKIEHSVSTKSDTVYSSIEVKQNGSEVVVEEEKPEEPIKVPQVEKSKEIEAVVEDVRVEQVVEEPVVAKVEEAVKKPVKAPEEVPIPAPAAPVVPAAPKSTWANICKGKSAEEPQPAKPVARIIPTIAADNNAEAMANSKPKLNEVVKSVPGHPGAPFSKQSQVAASSLPKDTENNAVLESAKVDPADDPVNQILGGN